MKDNDSNVMVGCGLMMFLILAGIAVIIASVGFVGWLAK